MAWCGQRTLWLIAAGPVESLRACHSVTNVFIREIMKVMISTCSGVRLEVHVIVGMLMCSTSQGKGFSDMAKILLSVIFKLVVFIMLDLLFKSLQCCKFKVDLKNTLLNICLIY